tara:strand:- start:1038 stop:3065 length:2028 start_codon:yes stop_codon:yes gene_type:complete
MAVDYGFFEALTGPMQAAGAIQNNRDAQKMQELQLLQQQRNMELQQLDKQKQQQQQLNVATNAAMQDLFTKNNFSRQKDVDDFRSWHTTSSGWEEIKNVISQSGSVDNARLNYNLDYLLQEYYGNLKDNPISRRTNKNKAALELYHSYDLDKAKNSKLLTSGARKRYADFVGGKSDNFIFNGARNDYLSEVTKGRSMGDNINIDDVIADNYSSIIIDMVNDQNPADPQAYMQSLDDQDIRDWTTKELNYMESGDVSYFGDKAIYGEKEIDIEFSTELVRALDATNKTQIFTGNDWFQFKDSGISFNEVFDESVGIDWDRLGGYDKTSQMESYKGLKAPFSKSKQVVGSGKIFAYNRGLEDQITQAWSGTYNDENKTPKYNSKNRQVYDVGMLGLYDARGHKIQDQDIASMNITGKDLWQESETDDLRLTGYHVALEGKNADGDAFLLTDVTNKKDLAKMREQYANTQFDYVIVAELIDDDFPGPDDAYYKKVDLGDATIQAAINQNVPSDNLNNVKRQMINYEQGVSLNKMAEKRKVSNSLKLQKQMNLPDAPALEQVINAYDQSLTVGLGTAGVNSSKIQQALPMLISDLFVLSRQERAYPHSFGDGTVANNSSEYMAYSARKLKSGLINDPNFSEMLNSIQEGNYDAYSKQTMSDMMRKQSRRISKGISKYQR